MTHGKLSMGAVLLAAGLVGACSSSSNPSSPGTGGTTGTGGASAGSTGTGGAGGTTGTGGKAGAGGATGGTGGSTGTGGTAGTGAGGALALPTELVSAMGCGNIRLVLAGGKIYYTNHLAGTVSSVAVTGGTPTVIAMAQKQPNPIAVDATSVYWGNDGDANVMKAPLAGGTAPTVFFPAATGGDAGAMDFPNALLVSDTTLFIGRGLDAYKIPTAGGTAVHISHSAENGFPGAFVFDGTHLFQTEMFHNAITKESIDGTQKGAITDGSIVTLAPDRIAVSRASLVPDAIAISGTNLVWANGTNIEFKGKDLGEKEGTLAILVTTPGFNALSGFLISGNKVYLGETSDNNVEVTPLQFTDMNATPTVIAMHQPNPAEFAADDTNIYFTTITKNDATGVCKIMKLAK
jgi:hypothetical protein